MKYHLSILLLVGLALSGCSTTLPTLNSEPSPQQSHPTPQPVTYEAPTPQKLANYQTTMRSIASGIKNDPSYQRLELDTDENKAWFKDLTYRLWDRQITKETFLAQGLKKYPTHRYEFNFVINGLQAHS